MAKANGMTQTILQALEEGPATTLELAIDLRLPRRSIAARISDLSRMGLVWSRGRVPTRTRPARIWEAK